MPRQISAYGVSHRSIGKGFELQRSDRKFGIPSFYAVPSELTLFFVDTYGSRHRLASAGAFAPNSGFGRISVRSWSGRKGNWLRFRRRHHFNVAYNRYALINAKRLRLNIASNDRIATQLNAFIDLNIAFDNTLNDGLAEVKIVRF